MYVHTSSDFNESICIKDIGQPTFFLSFVCNYQVWARHRNDNIPINGLLKSVGGRRLYTAFWASFFFFPLTSTLSRKRDPWFIVILHVIDEVMNKWLAGVKITMATCGPFRRNDEVKSSSSSFHFIYLFIFVRIQTKATSWITVWH